MYAHLSVLEVEYNLGRGVISLRELAHIREVVVAEKLVYCWSEVRVELKHRRDEAQSIIRSGPVNLSQVCLWARFELAQIYHSLVISHEAVVILCRSSDKVEDQVELVIYF